MGLKRIKMIQEDKVSKKVVLNTTNKSFLEGDHTVYIMMDGLVTPVKFHCGIARVRWETEEILRQEGLIK